MTRATTACSPADTYDLDGDSNTAEPLPIDLAGNARVFAGEVDMGAYELVYTPDFVVDTTSDADLEGCTATPADCSLRGAINLANAIAGTDTITFDSNVFTSAATGTITLTGALPQITTDLNITGLGADKVIVDGANSYQPFDIALGATVSINNITISHGNAVDGGGLYNSGTTTVAQSIFTNNSANTVGGGIENVGTLTVVDSSFNSNSAEGGGSLDNVGSNDNWSTATYPAIQPPMKVAAMRQLRRNADDCQQHTER